MLIYIPLYEIKRKSTELEVIIEQIVNNNER